MSTFEIFNDMIEVVEALEEVKKSLYKNHNGIAGLKELEEKALDPIKDICKKISQLLHFHIGQGEQKMSELEGALNIKGAKQMLAKHEKFTDKEGK